MSNTRPKQLEVRVKLDFEDFLRFNLSLYYGRFWGMLMTILGAGALIIFAIQFIPAFRDKGISIINNYLPMIVLILLFLLLIPVLILFQSKKIMSVDKFLQTEQLYTFHEDGIDVSSELVKATIKWNEVFKAVSFKHIIAIFVSKNKALIIPTRVFSGSESKQELIKILKKHVSEKKLKIKK